MRLAERRDALVAESARRRAQLALQLAPVRRALGIADGVTSTLRSHPLLLAAGAALLARARGRPILPALARLAPLYALLRR